MNKKFYLFLFAFLYIVNCSNAQEYSIHGGTMIPTGGWGDYWSAGLGIQASYKLLKTEEIKIGGSIGFFSIPGQEADFGFIRFNTPDALIIPILGTLDLQIDEQIYVGGDAGYNVISFDLDSSFGSLAGSSLALIPKVGVKFGGLSGEIRYNILGDNYLSLMVGYSFGG